MAEDLFGSFSGINSINTTEGDVGGDSWLIKQNGMLLGPMETSVVNNKMLSGEIDTKSLVAAEGSEEFNPLRQVAVFRPVAQKAEQLAAERAAKKKRNGIIALVAGLVVLGGSAVATCAQLQIGPFEPPPPPPPPEKKLSLDDIPVLKLVALADIEKAAESITVKEDPKPEGKDKVAAKGGNKTAKKKGSGSGKVKADEEEVVAGCQLDTKVIIGVVQRSAGKWVSCIQNLAANDPGMVPDKLILSFTVTPAGKLTNFEVGNRELRKHPVRNCLFKQFSSMSFPTSKGTNCNVDNWTIPLKK